MASNTSPTLDDINAAIAAQSQPTLDDINKAIAAQSGDEGLVSKAGKALSTTMKAIDSVTGAPTRSAIYAAQNGQNPLSAAWDQFGNMSKDAPTGADIAAKAGVSTDRKPFRSADEQREFDKIYNPGIAASNPQYQDEKYFSPAQVVGAGIDQAANPINLVAPGLKAAAKVGEIVSPAVEGLAGKLRGFAEDTAVNATGATGKQATTFAPTAGRELLDRGIVRFGDSQKQIAQRASDAVDQANAQIDAALSKLDAKGVKVDSNTVYNTVRDTINKMKSDPSKADIANNLENELNNLVSSTEAKGTPQYGMQEAEDIKRGYNRKAGNWTDPEKSQAGKTMYQAFRGAVEDSAQAEDPSTAQAFTEGKKTYGLLTPIEEAAARRAATANQHPAGGFLDSTMLLAGEHAGGPITAITAPIARRIISPRIASSIAVGADKAANVLSGVSDVTSPQSLASVPSYTGPAASAINNGYMPSPQSFAPAASVPQQLPKGSPPMSPVPPNLPAQSAPTKGPEKWANDGFQKLKSHVDDDGKEMLEKYKGAMLVDPKSRNLLMTASSFSPGSKPLDQIMQHLKNKYEGKK